MKFKCHILLFLVIFLLIPSLMPSAYGVKNLIAEKKVSNHIKNIKKMHAKKVKELVEKLESEIDIQKIDSLNKQIIENTNSSNFNFKVKDSYLYGDKVRVIVEITHQANFDTLIDFKERLEDTRGKILKNNRTLPNDFEVTCFNESLALCKNKKTSFDLEVDYSTEDGVDNFNVKSFSNSINVLKSLF